MKILVAMIGIFYSLQSFALANPASVYCAQAGGTTSIETLPSQDQIGICVFGINKECEEWAFFRKNCPAGGANTEQLNNQERYCVIIGGTLIKTQCLLPTKQICDINDLYNQQCPNRP
jgi:putative hemolysin